MRLDELRGRRVLVTGASGGIGAGIARAFGEQGARVVVHYRSREAGAEATCESIRAAGGQAIMLHADLRNEAHIERLAEQAWRQWDGIDALINNAGVVLKADHRDTDSVLWDDTQSVNTRAPFLLGRNIAGRMVEAGIAGSIVNISSIHAERSTPGFAAYAASKAALEALGDVMALELAADGIRVNTLSPGVIPVERTAAYFDANGGQWLPHIPLGRFGRPQDVAGLCLYLCSDAAGWVTGQNFVVDGGGSTRIDLPQRPRPPLPPRPDPVEE